MYICKENHHKKYVSCQQTKWAQFHFQYNSISLKINVALKSRFKRFWRPTCKANKKSSENLWLWALHSIHESTVSVSLSATNQSEQTAFKSAVWTPRLMHGWNMQLHESFFLHLRRTVCSLFHLKMNKENALNKKLPLSAFLKLMVLKWTRMSCRPQKETNNSF